VKRFGGHLDVLIAMSWRDRLNDLGKANTVPTADALLNGALDRPAH